MDYSAAYSRCLRYSADAGTVDHFLHLLGSHPDHRVPNSNVRMVAADAFDEVGRSREAAVLRDHPDDVHVFRGRVSRFHPDDIREAASGYKTAALWASVGEDDRTLDYHYHTGDLHPSTAAEMERHVHDFLEDNYDHVTGPSSFDHLPEVNLHDVGHDFWLSRNGHGAGFFYRHDIYGDSASHLQEQANNAGEYHLYIGDDGLIHGHHG